MAALRRQGAPRRLPPVVPVPQLLERIGDCAVRPSAETIDRLAPQGDHAQPIGPAGDLMRSTSRANAAGPAQNDHAAATLGGGLQSLGESVQLQFAPDIGRAGPGASHRLVTIANR